MQKLESIGILAGGIAHDFNNILTGVIGNISFAKTLTNKPDEMYNILTEAEKASWRARDLTLQLLTFSKGGAPIKKTTSIAKLLKDTADFALRCSNIQCEFSISDDLWPVDIGDGQMSQVINNLVINACQAMPEGGLIKIYAENMIVGPEHVLPLQNGRYIKISIKNRGVGISKEHLPYIFDPYFTTKHNGNGLGLATSYSIIKRYDGHIVVESEIGFGTICYLYLSSSFPGSNFNKYPSGG